jgi:hypothetical protein
LTNFSFATLNLFLRDSSEQIFASRFLASLRSAIFSEIKMDN